MLTSVWLDEANVVWGQFLCMQRIRYRKTKDKKNPNYYTQIHSKEIVNYFLPSGKLK